MPKIPNPLRSDVSVPVRKVGRPAKKLGVTPKVVATAAPATPSVVELR